MSAARMTKILQRIRPFLRFPERRTPQSHGAVAGAIVLMSTALLAYQHTRVHHPIRTVHCEEDYFDGMDHEEYPSGYTESERFFQSLEYHRSILFDYHRRWREAADAVFGNDTTQDTTTESSAITNTESNSRITWPRKVPKQSEVSTLEVDLGFCERSPNYRDLVKQCQDIQFRIASFYVSEDDAQCQHRGYRMVKDLAEHGHPDGMCLYGILLNEGRVAGVEANPQQAVVWWRRCVDVHRHITGMYELGVAMYTGEGVPENTEFAVKLFRQAAHLGHAGAAYMLGECLLAGVGVERDRGDALEWLVTAAELGHQLARRRVFVILTEEDEALDTGTGASLRKAAEAEKWVNGTHEEKVRAVNIERRFSVGGGSRNPAVLAKRKTIVQESRDDPQT